MTDEQMFMLLQFQDQQERRKMEEDDRRLVLMDRRERVAHIAEFVAQLHSVVVGVPVPQRERWSSEAIMPDFRRQADEALFYAAVNAYVQYIDRLVAAALDAELQRCITMAEELAAQYDAESAGNALREIAAKMGCRR